MPANTPSLTLPVRGVAGGWREGNHDEDDAPGEAWEHERKHATKRRAGELSYLPAAYSYPSVLGRAP